MAMRRQPGALRQARHRRHCTLGKLSQGFRRVAAGGKAGVGFARLPGRMGRRKMVGDFIVQQAFEGAVAAFAQRRIGLQRLAMRGGQRLRGLHGALQVAGEYGVERLVAQRRRQRLGLTPAVRVQGYVEMALQPPLGVPGGFAVADQQYFHGPVTPPAPDPDSGYRYP